MSVDPGGASAEATAQKENQQIWPPPEDQLEKWMMNTVKEGDQCSRFLRSLLQMNPAYGTYLQTDPDLFGVIQMFSKRLRTKTNKFEFTNQMPQDIFHQTLCEMLWRVVGWVMHEVVELEEEANMPVPKEASGMIKMLLNTNTQLTAKLNDLRRVYLKELAAHRDRQRHISAQTQRAIDQLHESPIMFFEPLEFVLDDSTKAFVREAIEERLKLEMRTNFQSNEDNQAVTAYIEELEQKVEGLQNELKTCRATNNRLEEQQKTQKEREEKLQADLKSKKEELMESQKSLAEAEERIRELQTEVNKLRRRCEHLEQKINNPNTADEPKEEEVKYIDINKGELEELRQRVKILEKELKEKDKEIEKLSKQPNKATETGGTVIKEVEKIVYQEDTESKALLLQAMQVEKELRAANEALEKALKETEEDMKQMEKELKSLGKQVRERPKQEKIAKPKGPSAEDIAAEKDAELEKKMKKVAAQHEKIVCDMQDEIDKLKAQLKEAHAELKAFKSKEPDDKAQKPKVVKQVGVPEEVVNELRIKIGDLEAKIRTMEDDYDTLDHKCQMLLEKLKDKFTDAEIENIVEKIKLTPTPKSKKNRKKKAYERLYDDAQRRIGEMKLRQNKLKDMEEKQLAKLTKKVRSPSEVRKLDMLHHLHRANSQTAQRFHDALSDFDKQTRRKKKELFGGEEGESGEDSSGDEEDDDAARRHKVGLSDLEEITLMTYKIGVCPRCAFSAMSAFHRRQREIYLEKQRQERSQSPTGGKDGAADMGTPWGSVLYLTDGQIPGRALSSTLGRTYSEILGSDQVHAFTENFVDVIREDDTGRQEFRNEPRPRSGSPRGGTQRTGSPMIRIPSSPSIGVSTQTLRRSPRLSPRGAGTPLGGGPLAGPLPYDSTFPLPTPPWRQELGGTQQLPRAPSTAPSLSSAPSHSLMNSTAPPAVLKSPMDASLRAGVYPKNRDTQMPDTWHRETPPWRRERSSSRPREGRTQSPENDEIREMLSKEVLSKTMSPETLYQPPSTAPLRGGGMEAASMYGRLGRHPGADWQTPPAPGRLPAAQTMSLDPIKKFSGQGAEDRSTSPEWTAKRPEALRTIRTAPSDLELDYSRPSTVPVSRKVPLFKRYNSDADLNQPPVFRSETGGEIHTFGGGARATIWKDAGSTHLPIVNPSRSAPTLHSASLPVSGKEVPWEPTSKKFGSKAPKKSGVGFMVTPMMSQERLSSTTPARNGDG